MKDVAQFFKVLADEVRLEMLWLLFHHPELCVCDIEKALGITQSKASRHLATLRHARLVSDRKAGAWTHYSLRPPSTDLERAQLEMLREKLGAHPRASQALRALDAWLVEKQRDAACASQQSVAARDLRGVPKQKPVPGQTP